MYPIEPFLYSTSTTIDSCITGRNVYLTHLLHEKFGHISVMNDEVQSATLDERIYHETLVHPALVAAKGGSPEKVLIVGGGEGCTAREVLRWNSVKHVDMIDWDHDVVSYFSQPFVSNLWNTETVWTDPRLHIQFGDIWEILRGSDKSLRKNIYDCIVVDLFDPETDTESDWNRWEELVRGLVAWLAPGGAIVFYTGMREVLCQSSASPCTKTARILEEQMAVQSPMFIDTLRYKTWIPSFGGESTFVVAGRNIIYPDKFPIESHLRKPGVWFSYLTWNDLGQTGCAI